MFLNHGMLIESLAEDLKERIGADNVGVLYLGDLDSFSLALSASRANKNVTLYVFELDQQSSDYVVKAYKIANQMNWSVCKVEIKTEQFLSQIREILSFLELTQKADLMHFFVLAECLSGSAESPILSGIGLNILCGLSKEYKSIDKCSSFLFRSKRLEVLARDSNVQSIEMLGEQLGRVIYAPYLSFRRTTEYFMERDWRQLNVDGKSGRVMIKVSLRDAYHNRIKERGLVVTQTKAFKASGLEKLMNEILRSKAVNFNSRRRLIELLMDWRLKRIESQRLQLQSDSSQLDDVNLALTTND